QKPNMIVVTNIDFDHPDIYSGIDEVTDTFVKFSNNLKSGGALIVNGDGDKNRNFIKKLRTSYLTFGLAPDNEIVAERITSEGSQTFFWVKRGETVLGQVMLNVFGEQNVLDALAAISACLE